MPDQPQMMTKEIARQQVDIWRQLAQMRPDDAEIQANFASCLFTLGEHKEALEIFPRAYDMNRGNAGIAMNYAMILKDMGRFSESAVLVQHAYQMDVDYFYLRLGWAESLLRNGNWREAWPLYDEARPGTKQAARNMLSLPDDVELWTGQKMAPGKNKLLVIGEGGTGDRITYSRWLPELTKMGIDWKYFPDNVPPIPGFYSLLTRTPWLQGRLAQVGDRDIEAHYWTTVFSLPAALDAIPTKIPQYSSWLVPDPALKQRFAIGKPPGDDRPIYGLIWGANELYEGGQKFRSLLESQAMRLVMSTFDLCHWVNCWHGDAHGTNVKLGQPVLNMKFDGWEETAALLANMDGIVSTDNGACWLAQALGKPVSILLSGNSDWKFLRGTEKCYWSDRARLFRNDVQGFEGAVTKCIAAIRAGDGVGRVQERHAPVASMAG